MIDSGHRTAIILSGGGVRAAYQLGLLNCIQEQIPDARFDIITGTSAGAINAAFLAAHRGPLSAAIRELVDIWSGLTFERIFRVDSSALGANVAKWGLRLFSGGLEWVPEARSLLNTEPLRELLESSIATVDGEMVGIASNLERDDLDAVALTTLRYSTGQTVTWIQGPDLQTWERPHRVSRRTRLTIEHVMASAALPILFPATKLGGDWYGDGGVRLSNPLAPAIHLGADRILAISTRYPRSRAEADRPAVDGYPPPAQILGTVLNSLFLDVIDQDALYLERVNRLVAHVPEEERGRLRPVELMVLRPSVDLGRLAADYETDLPRAFRFLTRGLGTRRTESPDFLSLLMFHPEYITHLIELGERDAKERSGELEGFFAETDTA